MKSWFILPLFFFYISARAQAIEGVYKKYHGNIKKAAITMDLVILDTSVTGSYYYDKIGQPISLAGSRHGQQINMKESVRYTVTGNFSGSISDDLSSISGKWQDTLKSKPLSFELTSFLPAGSAPLNFVEKKFSYEWQKNSKGESLGCKANYQYCYVADGIEKSVQKNINEVLIDEDMEGNESNAALTNLAITAMGDEFDDYTDNYSDSFPDSITAEQQKYMDESPYVYDWTKEFRTNVVMNENYLLCLREWYYEYTGGAHGNYGYQNIVFNLHSGNQLKLEDLVKTNSSDQLSQLAEVQLRKDFKVPPGQKLSDAGFLINHLEINNNFFVQKNGLGFTYSPYEIAPYVYGTINVVIPWDQLQAIIKPEGSLSWAITK